MAQCHSPSKKYVEDENIMGICPGMEERKPSIVYPV